MQPWDETRAANSAAQAAAVPNQRPAPGAQLPQSPNSPRFEPAPPQPAAQPEPARAWSSPGDDGWQAAAALAQPVRDGVTTTGLPRRVPKANLVPGQAGGAGAAEATPPAALSARADAVRQRLSTFRRNAQQLAGDNEQS